MSLATTGMATGRGNFTLDDHARNFEDDKTCVERKGLKELVKCRKEDGKLLPFEVVGFIQQHYEKHNDDIVLVVHKIGHRLLLDEVLCNFFSKFFNLCYPKTSPTSHQLERHHQNLSAAMLTVSEQKKAGIIVSVYDDDGDVLLMPKETDNGTKHAYQVSSKLLSLVSEVFKVMFFGDFKEAIALANSTTALPIDLPDDDPQALTMLCETLHHVTRDFTSTNDLEMFRKFFAIIDKYETLRACQYTGRAWLERFSCEWIEAEAYKDWNPPGEAKKYPKINGELLRYAHCFDDFRTFQAITRGLVVRPNGPSDLWSYAKYDSRFPVNVCTALDRLRKHLETELAAKLLRPLTKTVTLGTSAREDVYDERGNDHYDCKRGDLMMTYVTRLSHAGLWPVTIASWNLDEAAEKLIKCKNAEKANDQCGPCWDAMSKELNKVSAALRKLTKKAAVNAPPSTNARGKAQATVQNPSAGPSTAPNVINPEEEDESIPPPPPFGEARRHNTEVKKCPASQLRVGYMNSETFASSRFEGTASQQVEPDSVIRGVSDPFKNKNFADKVAPYLPGVEKMTF
ncbi:hypothetical protein FKW77_003506 [Venturia effusa]|uniref:BTB domain-containing protein n=1 Tax=Venturia effusa TaxID=50376 RepID=A0A517L8Z4_9PEZI|nr:hypothetical protein FKW77_003506 [Venturia effusa]